MCFFFFKQKTAYEMRISDWSSDVCSSDLDILLQHRDRARLIALTGIGADQSRRHRNLFEVARAGQRAADLVDLLAARIGADTGVVGQEIGGASCRERVGQYV